MSKLRLFSVFLPALCALALAASSAMASEPVKPPTLAERREAVQEQIRLNKSMSGRPVAEQLQIAQQWAKKHRTAMAPAALSSELTQAYAFRSAMLSDPHCQDYAQQADSVFLDSALDENGKADVLRQIGSRAQGKGCLVSQAP